MNIFRHTKYFELPLALMLTPDKVDALIVFKRTALCYSPKFGALFN